MILSHVTHIPAGTVTCRAAVRPANCNLTGRAGARFIAAAIRLRLDHRMVKMSKVIIRVRLSRCFKFFKLKSDVALSPRLAMAAPRPCRQPLVLQQPWAVASGTDRDRDSRTLYRVPKVCQCTGICLALVLCHSFALIS